MLKKSTFLIIAVATLLAFVACNNETKETVATTIRKDSLLKRGDYLVAIMGCNDCHSTKKMGKNGPEVDPAFQFGGHLANSPVPPIKPGAGKDSWVLFTMDQTMTVGPWGISYSANISSDSTGIANWKLSQFDLAMRKGKSKGLETGRNLLPPMPLFDKLSDTDLEAIFTYLKASKAVHNVVPHASQIEAVQANQTEHVTM